ncbi:hypothetical protein L13192_01998 [Pyrenophora tritici-repentis]|uniref:Uncharacterized protein n=2 Tax=Pyrenophora tritici-repentis TaxID=45151 RepID=A0A922T4D0_9PLEO|nr:uncharacterized protein PTRG_00493 [Pyrenophora tritici-repentis Pt-1C-BFP]EDU39931.1 predicted protein [Pyrenophora tritici-repentis Pt-1C-BFP]KAI1520377.1 hypothetical protein Ptr86124_000745 [Pyrenophora tritici-repentis]KAI1675251.1 hypothetical protein L13192_01998 [Pyrenophora tritici-repentis]KAI1687596.1 hypothetical protein KJE20_00773 [Pyrenophora tritici-repentis]
MRLLSLLFILCTAGARPVSFGLGPYQFQLQIPLLGEKTNTNTNSNDNGIEMISAPSIGLHFTTSYAMASAHFINGTTTDLFKMSADAEYTMLLSNWMDAYAEEAGTHAQSPSPSSPAPPHNTEPTTSNTTNILTPFLSKLYTAITTFEQSHGPITHITPAIFPLTTIHSAIFRTALLNSGLVLPRPASLTDADAVALLKASDAALAGLERAAPPCFKPGSEYEDERPRCSGGAVGCGDVQTQRQRQQRRRQQMKRLDQHVLFLSFDNTSFTASMVARACSSPSSSPHYTHLSYAASSNLGWYNLPVFSTPRALFWKRIQSAIVDVVGAGGKPPGRIMVIGERAGDMEFRGVVEEAVWRAWEVNVRVMIGKRDGEWGVARGAAEEGWLGV